MTTVREALGRSRALGVASLDSQLLLARALATTRTRLIAADDRDLTPDEARQWENWLERRLAGEPIAYLLGEKEFHGLLLEVSGDVLVPRPETELLVDWASAVVAALAGRRSGKAGSTAREAGLGEPRVGESGVGKPDVGEPGDGESGAGPIRIIDLGTGSGAIALALKRSHPGAEVAATDVSAAALAVARRNADRLGLGIELVEASWWHGVGSRGFDVAVANPPYIAAADPHLAALRHEPSVALTPGADGLAALHEIVAGAASHLAPGGRLLLEHGFDQGNAVRDLLGAAGFVEIETRRDLAGHERATGGRKAVG